MMVVLMADLVLVGCAITSSAGAARIPLDAGDPSSALTVADRHLYGHKRARRKARLVAARAA